VRVVPDAGYGTKFDLPTLSRRQQLRRIKSSIRRAGGADAKQSDRHSIRERARAREFLTMRPAVGKYRTANRLSEFIEALGGGKPL